MAWGRGRSVNLSRSAVLRGLPGANGLVLSFLTKPSAASRRHSTVQYRTRATRTHKFYVPVGSNPLAPHFLPPFMISRQAPFSPLSSSLMRARSKFMLDSQRKEGFVKLRQRTPLAGLASPRRPRHASELTKICVHRKFNLPFPTKVN